MSYDEQPDGDPHGECAAEIQRLNTEILEQCRSSGMGAEREARLMAQLAESQVEIERLRAENAELFEAMQHPSYEEENRLRAEIDAVVSALPGVLYMDPPDGGSVSLAEQVRRMSAENTMLRTGDTCARQCEGQAYRFEAQRLKRENEALRCKLDSAPVAIMDTRDVLGICAPTEEDFPALYAIQGKRVRLVVEDEPATKLQGD